MPKPNGGKLGVRSRSQGIIGLEEHYIFQSYKLGTASNPATSASELKASGITDDAAYFYRIGNNIRQLWTDFSSFPSHPMVLINRLSSNDNLQYYTSSNNPEDLSLASTSAPSRSAKLSDTEISEITVDGAIRWVIGANKQIFYRSAGGWTSNFGAAASCNYTTPYYSGYATPSDSPTWDNTFGSYSGGCGGGQDDSGAWLVLSGIHTSDSNYYGAYVGPSTTLSDAPSQYVTSTASGWGQPGYIFLEW